MLLLIRLMRALRWLLLSRLRYYRPALCLLLLSPMLLALYDTPLRRHTLIAAATRSAIRHF